MGGLPLDEIGAPVTAGEAFADDLGGEAEVGAAFATAEMGGVAGEELSFGGNDGGGVEIRESRRGRSGTGRGRED